MSFFIKTYKYQLLGADFAFKTAPKWLMKLMLFTGKYYKTKIDDDLIIYKKPKGDRK